MANGAVVTNDGKNLVWDRISTIGTKTGISQFRIGTGTNTPLVTDTTLQTPVLAAKDFLTGYPTFDIANRYITIRGQVTSAEANGNTLTEVGVLNKDGSPVLFSRHVHDGIVKNAQIDIVYELIYQVT